jgi:hypothetical protein
MPGPERPDTVTSLLELDLPALALLRQSVDDVATSREVQRSLTSGPADSRDAWRFLHLRFSILQRPQQRSKRVARD